MAKRHEVMQGKEVYDLAQHNSVAEVAKRSTEDQAQSRAIEPAAAAAQQPHDQACRANRDHAEQISLPSCGVAQKTERRTRVEREHEAEEIGQRSLLSGPQRRKHQPLGGLIGSDDGGTQDEPQPPAPGGRGARAVSGHANTRISPSPNKLATHLAQSVGCAASAPTSERQCQQRAHFTFGLGMTSIASVSPRNTFAAEVIITKRRSPPSDTSAS